jgi:hypothetical protein
MHDPENWIGTTLLAIVGVVFATGVGLSVVLTAVRNCFARPRPVGFCRRCGYCLRGNVSGVCPECGSPSGKGA